MYKTVRGEIKGKSRLRQTDVEHFFFELFDLNRRASDAEVPFEKETSSSQNLRRIDVADRQMNGQSDLAR